MQKIRYYVTLKDCPNGAAKVRFDFGFQTTWRGYDDPAIAMFKAAFNPLEYSLWRDYERDHPSQVPVN